MSLKINEPVHAQRAGYRLWPSMSAFPALQAGGPTLLPPGGMQSMSNPSLPPNMNVPGIPLPAIPSPMHPPTAGPIAGAGMPPLTIPPDTGSSGGKKKDEKKGIVNKVKSSPILIVAITVLTLGILYFGYKKFIKKGRK